MPILVDFSPVANAALYVNMDHLSEGGEIQLNIVRHMIFNTIRKINNMHSKKYGEVIVCFDSGNVWRKDKMSEYKANRAARREDMDHIDWDAFYAAINTTQKEIQERFPYLSISADRAEADDIIGTLCAYISHTNPNEKILILSTDGDFQQLQKFGKVAQYSTRKDGEFIRCEDPKLNLLEKIMKGDKKDGIPSIRSPANFFVEAAKWEPSEEGDKKPRQKPVSKKLIEKFYETPMSEIESVCDAEENQYENFKRNRELIDLTYCPKDIQRDIIEQYRAKNIKGNFQSMMDLFVENELGMLLEQVDEFKPQ